MADKIKWFQGEIVGQQGMVLEDYKDPYYINEWDQAISINPDDHANIKGLVSSFLTGNGRRPVRELIKLYEEYSLVPGLPALKNIVVPLVGDVGFDVREGKLIEVGVWDVRCEDTHLCGNASPVEDRPCRFLKIC